MQCRHEEFLRHTHIHIHIHIHTRTRTCTPRCTHRIPVFVVFKNTKKSKIWSEIWPVGFLVPSRSDLLLGMYYVRIHIWLGTWATRCNANATSCTPFDAAPRRPMCCHVMSCYAGYSMACASPADKIDSECHEISYQTYLVVGRCPMGPLSAVIKDILNFRVRRRKHPPAPSAARMHLMHSPFHYCIGSM
jgi:hypothetical protein